MKKKSIKNIILNRKISISTIIILLVVVGVLLNQNQNYKYTLLYQYQAIPDIELKNTLQESQSGIYGEVSGFVKFNDNKDQPKNLKQYYIIKPLNKFDQDLHQIFSVEEIIKMNYLPPKSTGVSELVEINKTYQIITLEDKNGNQFFIDRTTKEISMKDATGDNTELITDELVYRDFMKEWLK